MTNTDWRTKLFESSPDILDNRGRNALKLLQSNVAALDQMPHLKKLDPHTSTVRLIAKARSYSTINPDYMAEWDGDTVDEVEVLVDKTSRLLDIERLVVAKCQPFLAQSDNYPVYRGMLHLDTNSGPSYEIRRVRTDRVPRDSAQHVHAAINSVIAKSALVANRSNSVFCSGHSGLAASFGVLCRMYPIGDFNYTWDRRVKDVVQLDQEARYYLDAAIADGVRRGDPGTEDAIDHFVRIADLLSTESWEEYYLPDDPKDAFIQVLLGNWPPKDISYQRTVARIQHAMRSIRQKLIPLYSEKAFEMFYADKLRYVGDDGSLVEAIQSGHEIMIHCKNVIIIPERYKL